jgi:quercetin dioxygenase-like cupin family protein
MTDAAIILPPGHGEKLGSLVVKAARPELALFEFDVGDDFGGTGPHFHKLHSDAFYVIGGSIDFRSGDETSTGAAGAFVLFPPGVVHGFTVGPEGARFLNLHTPGGFERYIDELVALRRDGVEPDAEFFARHDIYYV